MHTGDDTLGSLVCTVRLYVHDSFLHFYFMFVFIEGSLNMLPTVEVVKMRWLYEHEDHSASFYRLYYLL